MITSISQLDSNKIYSYADYLAWKFEERIELLRGKIAAMSAPSRMHQDISSTLHISIGTALLMSRCKVYHAPFDVRLPHSSTKQNKEIITVVQPDICVVCDRQKLDSKGCLGAPDLVIEILSPGNSRREMKDKYEIYQEAGVLEYWIVNPLEKTINIYQRNEQGLFYTMQPLLPGDFAETPIIPGLKIDVEDVFLD